MNSFSILEHENKGEMLPKCLMKVDSVNIDAAERKRIEPSNNSSTESIASYSYMHGPYYAYLVLSAWWPNIPHLFSY